LEPLLDEMAQENRRDAGTEQADEQFHLCIAEAAGNSAMAAAIAWLWELRNKSEISTHCFQRVREEGVKSIVADHRAIVDALQLGDSEQARRAMTSHLRRVIDNLLQYQQEAS
jgi:DNA-binding FadR family transcriptional regulator